MSSPPPLPVILGVTFSAFASTFTPNLYAESSIGPGRVQNICFLFWVLVCVTVEISVILCIQHILSKALAGQTGAMERVESAFSRYSFQFLAVIVLLTGFFAANYIIVGNRNELCSVSATLSLADGSARRYDQALDQRLEVLLSDAPTAVLDPLTEEPYVLYMGDIYDDITSWKNEHMARYYHKDWVRLK